jgi:hypothetical protein
MEGYLAGPGTRSISGFATQCAYRCHHANAPLPEAGVIAACEHLVLLDQVDGLLAGIDTDDLDSAKN